MATRKAAKKVPPEKATSTGEPVAAAIAASPPPLRIVGIGASAGGLEAYEKFFKHVTPASGLAYVLVPHLDPSHVSILAEILQRSTMLPVVEVEDHVVVMADHVYVVPPNREMVIVQGALRLSAPEVPRSRRLPIDGFMSSLAEDQHERAVGIVLSGTGSDGTLGLRAIRDAGGTTLVQDPATAKYDGMPESAIAAGNAGAVMAPEDMPAALLSGAHPDGAPVPGKAVTPVRADGELWSSKPEGAPLIRLLMLVRSATGHDFSQYKKSTLGRRIERRMAQHDLTDIDVYIRYCTEHPAELRALFRELLINVTSFFRDPDAFAYLKQETLPQLLAGKAEKGPFRAWVAGCASGEEAYTIAMLLREHMDETHCEVKVQIYATDLDDDAIATARSGCYPSSIVNDLTPERLRRFFIREDAHFRIRKDIREMVVFATQNVIKDPPFTHMDLISCRNLLIYLEPKAQATLIATLHWALRPGGTLLLSPSESIGDKPTLFAAANLKWKISRAINSAPPMRGGAGVGPARFGPAATGGVPMATPEKETNFAELTRRALLQSYAPASVVADADGNILFVHGETGKYLRPAPGQATLNVVQMAREGLQVELRAALRNAVQQGAPTLERQVYVKSDGETQAAVLSVRPLPDPGGNAGLLLVSFQDAAPAAPAVKSARAGAKAGTAEIALVADLRRELNYTRESLQATIEGQQGANEELKSANEELQSTNEELQSTNEELETSKEELQSLNEELLTVNGELQAKIEELARIQNDMKNLIDNISVGTIFLDQHLSIRRFTREATRMYRLVASDVGRPLTDIKSTLEGGDVIAAAQSVLDTLVPWNREMRTEDGGSFLVAAHPYRTVDNLIEGVVLTFSDISARVRAEAAEHRAKALAESIVDTVREPLIVLDGAFRVVKASRAFYENFRVAPGDTVGRPLFSVGDGQWDIPALRELLEDILPRDQTFDGLAVEHAFPGIGRRQLLLNARRIAGEAGQEPLILLGIDCRDPPA